MEWLHKILFPRDHKFTWFVYTIIGSSLPIIFRLLGATSGKVEWIDFKDFLFAGIAINLSNFALVGDREFEYKNHLIGLSVILMVLLSDAIMVFLITESRGSQFLWTLYIISTVILLLSIYISYVANDAVFDKN